MIAGDPVETGIVPSLAHPRGNITGVSLMASPLTAKAVDLFRDMLPSVRRVAVLGHAANPVWAKAMLDQVLFAGGPAPPRGATRPAPRNAAPPLSSKETEPTPR